ncbi:MAG: hypothetical protein ACRDD8_10525 [Bacteroidales bacterium]
MRNYTHDELMSMLDENKLTSMVVHHNKLSIDWSKVTEKIILFYTNPDQYPNHWQSHNYCSIVSTPNLVLAKSVRNEFVNTIISEFHYLLDYEMIIRHFKEEAFKIPAFAKVVMYVNWINEEKNNPNLITYMREKINWDEIIFTNTLGYSDSFIHVFTEEYLQSPHPYGILPISILTKYADSPILDWDKVVDSETILTEFLLRKFEKYLSSDMLLRSIETSLPHLSVAYLKEHKDIISINQYLALDKNWDYNADVIYAFKDEIDWSELNYYHVNGHIETLDKLSSYIDWSKYANDVSFIPEWFFHKHYEKLKPYVQSIMDRCIESLSHSTQSFERLVDNGDISINTKNLFNVVSTEFISKHYKDMDFSTIFYNDHKLPLEAIDYHYKNMDWSIPEAIFDTYIPIPNLKKYKDYIKWGNIYTYTSPTFTTEFFLTFVNEICWDNVCKCNGIKFTENQLKMIGSNLDATLYLSSRWGMSLADINMSLKYLNNTYLISMGDILSRAPIYNKEVFEAYKNEIYFGKLASYTHKSEEILKDFPDLALKFYNNMPRLSDEFIESNIDRIYEGVLDIEHIYKKVSSRIYKKYYDLFNIDAKLTYDGYYINQYMIEHHPNMCNWDIITYIAQMHDDVDNLPSILAKNGCVCDFDASSMSFEKFMTIEKYIHKPSLTALPSDTPLEYLKSFGALDTNILMDIKPNSTEYIDYLVECGLLNDIAYRMQCTDDSLYQYILDNYKDHVYVSDIMLRCNNFSEEWKVENKEYIHGSYLQNEFFDNISASNIKDMEKNINYINYLTCGKIPVKDIICSDSVTTDNVHLIISNREVTESEFELINVPVHITQGLYKQTYTLDFYLKHMVNTRYKNDYAMMSDVYNACIDRENDWSAISAMDNLPIIFARDHFDKLDKNILLSTAKTKSPDFLLEFKEFFEEYKNK